jgi:hypothetical protein
MKINSSYKDYYDSASSLGIDKSIVYNRESSEIQIEETFFIDGLPQHFPDDFPETLEYIFDKSSEKRNYCDFKIVGFCGLYFVGLFNTTANGAKPRSMAYYGEEISLLDWKTISKNKRYPSEMLVVKEAVKKWNFKRDDSIFIKLNAPIFVAHIQHSLSKYEMKNRGLYLDKFEINPNLNDYQFYKMADSFSAFQSIQSYISGVLGTQENNIIEVDNKSKILKAGFDLKTSFRKDKEK